MAGSHKKVTLELGGKAANIVFDDAPIDQAVEGIVNGIFFNQGHVCCAGSRLLVQESVADDVLARLKRRMATLRVGDPLDKNTDIGAINSAEQLAKIRELSDIGEAEGAGRWSPPCELPKHGFWFPPTIFTGVTQAHRIAREEIFGPVLSVLTFRTPAEAVEKANNTPYGLSAGVWTDKGSRILHMANKLRAGVVWANTFNKFDPTSPFGGYKESGYGREGGRHGLAGYLKGGSTSDPRRRPQDLQALHRRAVPALGVRPLLRRRRRQGQVRRQRRAGLAQGRPRRRARGPGGVRRLGGQDGLQPRPDPLPRRRGHGGPAAAVRRGAAPVRGPHADPGRQGRRRRASTGSSGTPGGPTRSPRSSATPTRSPGPFFNLSTPEPTGVVAVRRAAAVQPARPGLGRRAGRRHRQHRRGAQLATSARCRR